MQPLYMWGYWRDDKGLRSALEDYYPELLNDPKIAWAMSSIQAAKLMIDNRILELSALESEN